MPSYYAQYLLEREGVSVLETERGMAVYVVNRGTSECYLRDIWVHPDFRQQGEASRIADRVAQLAKDNDCTVLTGTVDPKANGSRESMLAVLGYGMRPHSVRDGLVWFVKELK